MGSQIPLQMMISYIVIEVTISLLLLRAWASTIIHYCYF